MSLSQSTVIWLKCFAPFLNIDRDTCCLRPDNGSPAHHKYETWCLIIVTKHITKMKDFSNLEQCVMASGNRNDVSVRLRRLLQISQLLRDQRLLVCNKEQFHSQLLSCLTNDSEWPHHNCAPIWFCECLVNGFLECVRFEWIIEPVCFARVWLVAVDLWSGWCCTTFTNSQVDFPSTRRKYQTTFGEKFGWCHWGPSTGQGCKFWWGWFW